MKRPLLWASAVVALVFVVGIHSAAPRIRHYPQNEAPFLVTFEPGLFGAACTVYQSLTETIVQDGKTVPYAPRHCGGFASEATQASYVDDWAFIIPNGGEWDVWAELYTETGVEARTNTIRVTH
jgi:hypothetical protein